MNEFQERMRKDAQENGGEELTYEEKVRKAITSAILSIEAKSEDEIKIKMALISNVDTYLKNVDKITIIPTEDTQEKDEKEAGFIDEIRKAVVESISAIEIKSDNEKIEQTGYLVSVNNFLKNYNNIKVISREDDQENTK